MFLSNGLTATKIIPQYRDFLLVFHKEINLGITKNIIQINTRIGNWMQEILHGIKE
jgi:hypothetical protein